MGGGVAEVLLPGFALAVVVFAVGELVGWAAGWVGDRYAFSLRPLSVRRHADAVGALVWVDGEEGVVAERDALASGTWLFVQFEGREGWVRAEQVVPVGVVR